MDFISIILGMGLGCLATILGIGIKILYFRLIPYLEIYHFAKNTLKENKGFLEQLGIEEDKEK
jgi:hypothetical protein